jgi:hypothetical protein
MALLGAGAATLFFLLRGAGGARTPGDLGDSRARPGRHVALRPKEIDARDPYAQMIFFAVLEGLYQDGASNEIVDAVLAPGSGGNRLMHFVYACPICSPAADAFRTYRARVEFCCYKVPSPFNTFGPGLDAAVSRRILSGELDQRLQAIDQLVETWVRRRLDSMRLSVQELARWKQGFELRRKLGMELLRHNPRAPAPSGTPSPVERCPFCDGAARACDVAPAHP